MTKFLERMRKIDPNYGSEEHQQWMLWRLDYMERVAPCKTPESDLHEHGPACYSQDVKDRAIREQNAQRSSQPVKP